jgi:hypothetical protein
MADVVSKKLEKVQQLLQQVQGEQRWVRTDIWLREKQIEEVFSGQAWRQAGSRLST